MLPPALVQLTLVFTAPLKPSSKPSGRPQRMQRLMWLRIENLLLQLVRPRALPKKRSASFPLPRPRRFKAGSKVDQLRTKLAEATKDAAVRTLPGCGTAPTVLISPHSHSHKKCKGITGSPSSVHPPAVCSQMSLQQKTATANKRVSVQCHLQPPLRSPGNFSSSESSTFSSGDNNKMLVGKDTKDKIETPFVLPSKCRGHLPQGTRLEARGGCHYDSPLAHSCITSKPTNWPVTGCVGSCQSQK
jgi:hypothetical protein